METLMKMKWKIGSVEIENPFILAPMAGVTDLPFRILCKEQGAGLLCTEMVSAKAISFHNKNTISLMQIDPVEHPVSMQITLPLTVKIIIYQRSIYLHMNPRSYKILSVK